MQASCTGGWRRYTVVVPVSSLMTRVGRANYKSQASKQQYRWRHGSGWCHIRVISHNPWLTFFLCYPVGSDHDLKNNIHMMAVARVQARSGYCDTADQWASSESVAHVYPIERLMSTSVNRSLFLNFIIVLTPHCFLLGRRVCQDYGTTTSRRCCSTQAWHLGTHNSPQLLHVKFNKLGCSHGRWLEFHCFLAVRSAFRSSLHKWSATTPWLTKYKSASWCQDTNQVFMYVWVDPLIPCLMFDCTSRLGK